MKALLILWLGALFLPAVAQKEHRVLHLDLRCGDHPLVLDSAVKRADGSTIRITALRFYLGHIRALRNGKVLWTDERYHLMDAADPKALDLDLPVEGKVDAIEVMLGVDSLTNVSGAMGGDLDPTKGMYWTWNSGYINLKMEGNSSVRGAHGGPFEFHLGGYLPPFASAQRLMLPANSTGSIDLRVDLDRFFEQVDIAKEPNVMSPGERAVFLADLAARMFSCHAHP